MLVTRGSQINFKKSEVETMNVSKGFQIKF